MRMPHLRRLGGSSPSSSASRPAVPAFGQERAVPGVPRRRGPDAPAAAEPAPGSSCRAAARCAWPCRSGPRSPPSRRSTAAGWPPAACRTRAAASALFLLRGNDSASRPLPEPPGQEGRSGAGRCSWWTAAGSPASPGWRGTTAAPSPCAPPLWNGKRWQAPERVSFPGPGASSRSTGAVLADGSWLLAWSAFDGQDDEIVWARRRGRRLAAGARASARQLRARHHPGPHRHRGRRRPDRLEPLRRPGLPAADGPLRAREAGATSTPPPPPARSTPSSSARPRLLYLDAAAPRAWTVLDLDGRGAGEGEGLRPLPAGAAGGHLRGRAGPDALARRQAAGDGLTLEKVP